ncbi:uncharacterized protein CLUP02_12429 [Colletotrichum lupini]|uniref:Uncharacterized protein n=1 Tax=Colletotrichum lupini TaxID=145971 RepID=A0A9Q8T277_9PEZI|nr:uncharacterized protein CLUP02_12429 [Colletotrichum lupini]UQC86927.1 hypothetical protein CLUP02_12429 [Colletotrichum lupini]
MVSAKVLLLAERRAFHGASDFCKTTASSPSILTRAKMTCGPGLDSCLLSLDRHGRKEGHYGSVEEELKALAERIIAMLQQLLRRTNHNSTAMLQHDAFVKAGAGLEEAIVASSHTALTQMSNHFDNMSNNGPARDISSSSRHWGSIADEITAKCNRRAEASCLSSKESEPNLGQQKQHSQDGVPITWSVFNKIVASWGIKQAVLICSSLTGVSIHTGNAILHTSPPPGFSRPNHWALLPVILSRREQIGFSSQATIMQTRKQRVPAIGPRTDSHICNAIADGPNRNGHYGGVTRIRDLGDDMLGQPLCKKTGRQSRSTSCIGHKSLSTCIVPHQATAEHATGSSKMLWSAAWVSIADGHHGRSHIDKRRHSLAPGLRRWKWTFTTEKRAVKESNDAIAIETAKWHLRGDGASLASSRPLPNDKLRKQDAKKSRPWSSLDVDKQELSTSGCVSAEVAQSWDVCISKSRTRKDSAETTSAGRRCLGHNGSKRPVNHRGLAWLRSDFPACFASDHDGQALACRYLASGCRASTTRPPRQRLRMTQQLESAPAAQQSWTNQKIKSDGIRHACSGGGDRLYVGIFCLGERNEQAWGKALAAAIAKMEGRAIDERMADCVTFMTDAQAKKEIMGSKKTPHS